jgi:hypothetical protein
MFKPKTDDDDDENNDIELQDLTVLPGQGQGLDDAMNEVTLFLLLLSIIFSLSYF